MRARIVTGIAQPGKLDELIHTYQNSVVPAARQQRGFKGAYLLTNVNTGKGVSITLWESETDMLAGESSGYLREQMAKIASYLAAAPVVEHFEISVEA
jgi:heme-degrading monooxygenase HmoA